MRNAIISGKPQLNRRINTSIVLDLIQRKGPLSRADLAKQTGIRAASISAVVQQLIDEKLLVETGLGISTGGRQPTLLALNPSGLHTVGVEVEENGLNAILVDFTSQVLEKTHCPLPDTHPETVFEAIASAVDTLCSAGQIPCNELAGIGVALPGVIDMGEGRVILSLPLGWQNVEIGKQLSTRLNLNVRVLNNALAGALTAYYNQCAPVARSLLFVLVHFLQPTHNGATPLGCGIVLDGRAYMGEGNRAGEIHVDIEHPLMRAGSVLGKDAPTTMEKLVAQSCESPDLYKSIWESFAAELGAVVSRGIDFLNPGKVVIGTDLREAETLIGARLKTEMQSSHFKDKYAATGLVEDFLDVPIEFMTTKTETLAKGAIVPHLQEPSLAPSLRQGVLM